MGEFLTDEQLAQMIKELTCARFVNWIETDLFTWQWWFILAILLIPWIVFGCIVDKKQLPRLLLYGTLLMLLIITLDLTGFEIGLWYYPIKLLPVGPLTAYIDISPLPVIYMLEYQYVPRWKKFIMISFITGFVFSFCFEPIMIAIGLYIPIRWEHYYGLPIYILMPIIIRLAVEKVFNVAEKQC